MDFIEEKFVLFKHVLLYSDELNKQTGYRPWLMVDKDTSEVVNCILFFNILKKILCDFLVFSFFLFSFLSLNVFILYLTALLVAQTM
jgi:hypothetical protein